MYRTKIENEKAKVKQRANKKKAKKIAEWAERKQRAHDQMIVARMMCGHF